MGNGPLTPFDPELAYAGLDTAPPLRPPERPDSSAGELPGQASAAPPGAEASLPLPPPPPAAPRGARARPAPLLSSADSFVVPLSWPSSEVLDDGPAQSPLPLGGGASRRGRRAAAAVGRGGSETTTTPLLPGCTGGAQASRTSLTSTASCYEQVSSTVPRDATLDFADRLVAATSFASQAPSTASASSFMSSHLEPGRVAFDSSVEVVAFSRGTRAADIYSRARVTECSLGSRVQLPASWSFASTASAASTTLGAAGASPARRGAIGGRLALATVDEAPSGAGITS
ncbi:unnamed protein product [Prorocentrum cordatum]|uniref:Beta-galactosidase n=1 Tax=Prorocentrum cordatum TaxID=2364126 RepID=A0ABN9U767_9DINO|nr:unnamed protein product [Polarella glacialis]